MPYTFFQPVSIISSGSGSGIRLVSSTGKAISVNIADATQSPYTIVLPPAAPTVTGQALTANVDGTLSWGPGFDPAKVITLTNATTVPATAITTAQLTGALKVGGDLVLGSTSPKLFYPPSGLGPPSTVSRSDGSKIILWPAVGSTSGDYAIGYDSNTVWNSLPTNSNTYAWKWYAGTVPVMTLDGIGNLTIAGTGDVSSTTGASAAVQIKGGMNIAKSLWMGTTGSTDGTLVAQAGSGSAFLRFTANGTATYIQSGSSTTSGSLAPLYFAGYSTFSDPTLGIMPTGTITMGSTAAGTVASTAGQYLNVVSSTFTDNATVASGTVAAFNANYISQTTLAASNTGVVTNAASTLYIAGPPVAGTNQTLRALHALNVASGLSTFANASAATVAVVDTLGGNETAQIYPPTGNQILTGTNTTLTNLPYGNGNYYIAASSTANGFPAYQGFQDKVVGGTWSSAQNYNTTTGAYTGSRSTGDVATGTNYLGELIEVALPAAKYITQVTMYPRVANFTMAPKTFVIMASNTTNGNYKVVFNQSTALTWAESVGQTFTLTTPGMYNWIRIVGLSITSGAFLQFTFSFRATNPTLTLSNTTAVGSAVNSPLYGALNVSGDVVLASTNPRVYFPASGTGAPTLINRSAGSKLILSPTVSASLTDYAIGLDTTSSPQALWYGTPSTAETHKWYAGTVNTMTLTGAGNLTLTGQLQSPTITNASTTSLFNEDAALTSMNGATLSGGTVYNSNTAAPNYSYFTLATNGTGQLYYQVNPGTAFTVDFEMMYTGANDGLSCSFYQSSIPTDCYINNGGYAVTFSAYMNAIVIVPPGVSTARVGTTTTVNTGATAGTSSFVSVIKVGTWVPISVTYKNGFLGVFVNGSMVNSVRTITPAVATQQGTYVGFSGYSVPGSSYSVRNMRLTKSQGFSTVQGSGDIVYNNGTVNIGSTQDSTSVATGALQITNGGLAVSKSITLGNSIRTDTAAVKVFPPVYPLTSNSTVITADYGGGTYVASASSNVTGWDPYRGFSNASAAYGNVWSSRAAYDINTGAYTGGVSTIGTASTTDATSTTYLGEWLQIVLPVARFVPSIVISPRNDAAASAPTTFSLLASNDAVNWTAILRQTTAITWVAATSQTFTSAATTAYNSYRIVVTTTGGGNVTNVSNYAQLAMLFNTVNTGVYFSNTADAVSSSSQSGGAIFAGGIGIIKSAAIGGSMLFPNTSNVGPPTLTTRSSGSKIVLAPVLSAAQSDHAIGIESNALWYGVPTTSQAFKWYAGATNIMTLSGQGNITLFNTANQPLIATLQNSNAGAGSYAAMLLTNDTGSSLAMFINSSTRTSDGPANSAIIRNDAGDLYLAAKNSGTTGIQIVATTGAVTIPGTVTLANAANQIYFGSTTNTGSVGNVFFDSLAGNQFIYGYNTPKQAAGSERLQIYDNFTDRRVLLSASSAGTTSGPARVYVGAPLMVTEVHGIRLNAADGAVITKGYDAFTSGKYYTPTTLIGRYGVFMEPSAITIGGANLASKFFQVVGYNVDSTYVQRMSIELSTGVTKIQGAGAGGTLQVAPIVAGTEASISFYGTTNFTGIATGDQWTIGRNSWGLTGGVLAIGCNPGYGASLIIAPSTGAISMPSGTLTLATSTITSKDPGPQGTQTYPPSGFNFTTDTQTLTGQPYGNGTYTFTASSIVNGSWNSGQILQGSPQSTNGSWASGQAYNTATGAYTGANSLTVAGTAYTGETVIITFPSVKTITTVTITPKATSFTDAPATFVLCGITAANKAAGTYSLMFQQSTALIWTGPRTFTVTSAAYTNMAIIVQSLSPGTVGRAYFALNFTASTPTVQADTIDAVNLLVNDVSIGAQLTTGALNIADGITNDTSSLIRNFPPPGVQFTTSPQTISGQSYGNGTYTFTASSQNDATFGPHRVFVHTSVAGVNPYVTGNVYNQTTGAYTGSVSTSVSGTVYLGEIVTVGLPVAKTLTSVIMYPRMLAGFAVQAPTTFIIFGITPAGKASGALSLIFQQSTVLTWTEFTPKTFTVTGTYVAIGIILQTISANNGGPNCQFTFQITASSPVVKAPAIDASALSINQVPILDGSTGNLFVPGSTVFTNDVQGDTTARAWPPTLLSTPSPIAQVNTSTISGQSYANGTYVTSQSSAPSGDYASWACWKAFSSAGSGTFSSGQFYNASGVYTGSVSTTVGGTAYTGEWIQIQFPYTICLKTWISPISSGNPATFIIAGSNDGTTWTLLFQQSTAIAQATWSATGAQRFSVNSVTQFLYFRFICQTTTGYTYFDGSKIILNATRENVYISDSHDAANATTGALTVAGGIGVGKSMFVAGSVTIANTTNSTTTTSGALQVKGGMGIAGNITSGGNLSVSGNLTVSTQGIAMTVVNSSSTTSQTSITLQNTLNGTTGYLGLDGSGLQAFNQDALTLYVNNGKPIQLLTSARTETNAPIVMTNTTLLGAPTFTTRSTGTKLVLWPGLSATTVEYAFGIEAGTLWSSVPTTAGAFKWYAGTTNVASLGGDAHGIRQASADGAIITKGYDPFTSGKYYSANFPVSSWGLFMEPQAITIGGRNFAGKSFQVVGYNLDSTLVQRLSVDLSSGATSVSGTISVTTPGTGYVTSASFMQPSMATGFGNSLTIGLSATSMNAGSLSFINVGAGSASNYLKMQIANQQSGLIIRGDGAVLTDANLTIGSSQNVGTLTLGNQGGSGAGVVLADPAHAIYLRYNYGGTVNTVAHYSYGDIQFYNNGLIGAQTMKLSITASGNVTIPAGSLTVSSNLTVGGYAMIGTTGGGSTTVSNMLGFTGVSGDSSSIAAMNTAIVERIYAGAESSELLLFKGNDVAGSPGPDVVRIAAAEFYFDALSAAGSYNYSSNTLPAVTRRFAVTLTSSMLSVPLAITDNSASSLQVSGGASIAGTLNVTGSLLNLNSENSCLSIDAAGLSRLGFVKQAGFAPKIVSASGSNIVLGYSNQSNLTTNVAGSTIIDVMTIGSGGVNISSSLAVTGTISGPTVNSLSNKLVAYEDGSQTTLNSGFLNGAAIYQSGTPGQIRLSSGESSSGSLNWQASPGSSWSCDFEMWQDNGNDGIAFGVYQTSVLPGCYNNNGGYTVAFNRYRNAVLLAVPSVSTVDVGVANIVALSSNMSSFYTFASWNSISIKFRSGTLSVFCNGTLIGTYKGLPDMSAINRQGTYVSFGAFSNQPAIGMFVRNIRLERGAAEWELTPGTTSDIRYQNGSVTLGSTSVAATVNPTSASGGALNLTGDIVLGGSSSKMFFLQSGVAPPSKATRSTGSKLVLYPGLAADASDYALGIDGGTLWYSVPTTGDRHRWYSGNTNLMTLTGDGQLNTYNSADRPLGIYVRNTSSGSNSYAAVQMFNDTGASLALFLNSSTRTTDGPANSAIIRNDAGDLYLAAKATGTTGVQISATTGVVTISGTTEAGNTVDGAFRVTGGVGVGKNLQVGNEIVGYMGAGLGQFRAVFGNYGVMMRNDGTDFYLLATPSGSPLGAWNGNRPLRYNIAGNSMYTDSPWSFTNPAANALQVTGGVSIGQSMTLAGGLTFTGNTPVIQGTGSTGPLNIDPNFSTESYVRIYDRLSVAGTCDISGAVTMASSLAVTGTMSGPTVTSLSNSLAAYEDGSQSSLNSGTLSGAAIYQAGAIGQIMLSNGGNSIGGLNWLSNPGNAWTCDFEMWQDPVNDGVIFGTYQTAPLGSCYANNGGYAIAFNKYRNAVLLAIPSVTYVDVGVANIITLNANMTSFYQFSNWNTISIRFQSGALIVYYNGVLIGSYKGLPNLTAISRQGGYTGFGGYSNAAGGMYVRNVRVTQGANLQPPGVSLNIGPSRMGPGTPVPASPVLTANASLTADTYYANLTVNGGVTLRTNGYRLVVFGVLVCNGSINNDGGNGTTIATYNANTPAPGGAGGVRGSLGGGGAGGSSPNNTNYGGAGQAITGVSLGGAGGSGGAFPYPAGAGGAAGPRPTDAEGGVYVLYDIQYAKTGRTTTGVMIEGGSGGGGGSCYQGWTVGTGGGGGGVVIITCGSVYGTGSITANGGSGGMVNTNGNSSSGGGGGGGVLIFICTADNSTISFSAAGGNGGNVGGAGYLLRYIHT